MTRVYDDPGLCVRKVFPFFTWHQCEKCKAWFRREVGFHTVTGPWHGPQGVDRYVCGTCANKSPIIARWIFATHDKKFEESPPGNGENNMIHQAQDKIVDEVRAERLRQDEKGGVQDHHPVEWMAILGEEYGEACKGALEAHFTGYVQTGDYSQYRKELVQVAAVAIAALENLDRVS